MTARFAVLIDGDNIGAQHGARISRIAQAQGRVDVCRVYADLSQRRDWMDQTGFRLIHAGTGKNASDILLSIDAMELALRDGIDGFVLASSDGDFTHVAQRLRENGNHVIGIGEPKTPDSFRVACAAFEYLGPPPSPSPTPSPSPATELDRKIKTMIASHSEKGQGMRIADLAPKMHSSHRIKISSLPEKTWRGYLSKRPMLYNLDAKGPQAKVRFRPEGFAAQPA